MDIFTLLKVPDFLPKASSQQATDFRKSASNAFPFLEYAIHNVLFHANVAEGSGITQAQFLSNFQLSRWISLDNLLQKHEVRRHSADVNLLYLLGEHNMPNLVRVHPSTASCLEVENERYGCPLFAAMATGSKEATKMFLKSLVMGQSLRGESDKFNENDFDEELSQKSIGRDFKFLKGKSLLSYLLDFGFKIAISFLLKTGKVDVDSKDKDGQTPLWRALRNGNQAVVKLLLETGKVDVDLKNEGGQTPLSWAVRNGNEAVVKPLLEAGKVDVDSKDEGGQTPLSWAVWNGNEAVVKLLLETGKVDVDSKDEDGQTPLWRALRNGNQAIVKLLLETGKVDVDSKDEGGQTPLSWAVRNGNEAIVKLLLETGKVDVDSKDKDGWTPLSWAAWNGNEAVVNLLNSYTSY